MTRIDGLLTTTQLAEMMQCSRWTARRFILRERLGRKIGGRVKVRKSVILANYSDMYGTVMFMDI